MKKIELTEHEVRAIIILIEDQIKTWETGDELVLRDARHKLFMSLMDSPVPGDTKFIPDS